jgi:hypothetical protein
VESRDTKASGLSLIPDVGNLRLAAYALRSACT